ncbi:MAG: hypothetical protein AB8B72_06420 [Crocinitomicaceae bacterium]
MLRSIVLLLFFVLISVLGLSQESINQYRWRIGLQADMNSANLTKPSLMSLSRAVHLNYVVNKRIDVVLEGRNHFSFNPIFSGYKNEVSVLGGVGYSLKKNDSIIGIQIKGLYGIPISKFPNSKSVFDLSANLLFFRSFYLSGGFRYIRNNELNSLGAPINNFNLYWGIGVRFNFKLFTGNSKK